MNIVEIAALFARDEISLLQTCRKLDVLGYTFQEIRRIINGVIRAHRMQIQQEEKDEWSALEM